ncbi:uncharacterized protein LOC112049578 [Bicyclus anynana]|uniref:Uncharacterized protein LOC112049578 n=1 Tax=Bicyclus anynana TaxID=110368 RepID=A0A6J1N635_BICAN|nr:uncharacterized protein LOC112049578 [Bicyclus anynana]
MSQSQYSLSWEDHPKNICNGLSYLQQNGEFVDMTLAADGHFVKVHQVIMALSSPFIKDLIASANCPHPVIVLNKISQSTLLSILEYIYTGEVMVAIENIRDLIDAAKELHIKGLQEMNLSVPRTEYQHADHESLSTDTTCLHIEEDDIPYCEIQKQTDKINCHDMEVVATGPINMGVIQNSSDHGGLNELRFSEGRTVALQPETDKRSMVLPDMEPKKTNTLQYTVSAQGSLQLILNRFLYYLKYTKQDHTRQWRCVDYLTRTKCPAVVITKGNMVLQRILAHKHLFHDKKILKKVMANNVFTAFDDAEQTGLKLKDKQTESNPDSE